MATSEYAKSLGNRLRDIRMQQGLSLQGVEDKSDGRWKAVVIGSYERGDRSITVSRLSELADFYRVPVSELLPNELPEPIEKPEKVVLNLEALYDHPDSELEHIAKLARNIQQRRGDYNGRILSIRADDLATLAVVYGTTPSGLVEKLEDYGVVVHDVQAFFAKDGE
ncbi:transcriptional regulator [Salininema proteolyticum]|uniref:Transcriptional regulator n=1 Tax=Salininema proteolyticum TaxID=1607685 RepID=A0ABV8U027_9ACTN